MLNLYHAFFFFFAGKLVPCILLYASIMHSAVCWLVRTRVRRLDNYVNVHDTYCRTEYTYETIEITANLRVKHVQLVHIRISG